MAAARDPTILRAGHVLALPMTTQKTHGLIVRHEECPYSWRPAVCSSESGCPLATNSVAFAIVRHNFSAIEMDNCGGLSSSGQGQAEPDLTVDTVTDLIVY
jgi:hypothetical protein